MISLFLINRCAVILEESGIRTTLFFFKTMISRPQSISFSKDSWSPEKQIYAGYKSVETGQSFCTQAISWL